MVGFFRTPARLLSIFTLMLAPISAMATPPATTKSPAPANPFAIIAWAELSQHPLRASGIGEAHIDMRVHENEEDITVYGHKQRWDELPAPGTLLGEGGWSEASTPHDRPLLPPTSCSGSSFRTIGGQAATGEDLIGYGAGRC